MKSIIHVLALILHRQNMIAGLVGIALGSSLGYTLLVRAGQRQPVIIHSAYEIDGIAARGGYIDLFFDIDRERDCPAETSRWLWTWVDYNGMKIKQFFPLVSSSTTLTDIGHDQTFILSIPLPAGIWEGSWFYWAKTVEHCSLLPSFFRSPVRETPDIPVQVTDGGSDRRKPGAVVHPQ